MNKNLNEALQNVEESYANLIEIANEILNPILNPVNELVMTINSSINAISVDQLRDYILRLQLRAFEISEIKEKSTMKAELADAIQKEKFAIAFNGAEGSAAVKDKIALISSSSEVVTEVLYNLISNLLKTKLDQVHRLVDAMKSILMSRMQEAKFMNIGTTNEIPGTTNGRVVLNE